MRIVHTVVVLLVTICLSCTQQTESPAPEQELIPVAHIPEPTLCYGFPIDSLDVYTGRIKWSQTLSMILEKFNTSNELIYAIAQKSRGVFDVRKLKAGSGYTIIHERDSLRTARQFIFEPDRRSYVVFNLTDTSVNIINRKVDLVEKSISAVITSTVDAAINEAGAPQVLVSKIVDILAWQVYFGRIQHGDKLKIIYEEEQVDGEPIGLKNVVGVYFKHFDKEFYGIRYTDQTGKEDYFDEKGNSLRKTFLMSPVSYYKRISSRYSGRRYHPVLKRYKAHLGTDFAAAPGTRIRTTGDGVVVEATYHKYNGNYVKIRHNSNFSTQYLHMQKIKTGIRPGVKVKQGQTIGFVGSTGLARGPHVCYRFWKNGIQVDAQNVDLPPSEPINAAQLGPFLHQKNVVMHKMSLIDFDKSPVLLANVAGQP